MPQDPADPAPVASLRICYQTDILCLEDPNLYCTLTQCLDVLHARQRDFARSLTVTVTDVTTNTVVYTAYFERFDNPLHLPWLLVGTMLLKGVCVADSFVPFSIFSTL